MKQLLANKVGQVADSLELQHAMQVGLSSAFPSSWCLACDRLGVPQCVFCVCVCVCACVCVCVCVFAPQAVCVCSSGCVCLLLRLCVFAPQAVCVCSSGSRGAVYE
jgi:hypothetical protein